MQIWDIRILKIICCSSEIWIDLSICILSGNLITRDHCLGFTKHFYIHHFFWAKGLEIISTSNGSSSIIGQSIQGERCGDFLASQKSHMGTGPTCLWERRPVIVIREKGDSGQGGNRSKGGQSIFQGPQQTRCAGLPRVSRQEKPTLSSPGSSLLSLQGKWRTWQSFGNHNIQTEDLNWFSAFFPLHLGPGLWHKFS